MGFIFTLLVFFIVGIVGLLQEKDNGEQQQPKQELSVFDKACKSIVHTDDWTKTTMPRISNVKSKDFAEWINKVNHS